MIYVNPAFYVVGLVLIATSIIKLLIKIIKEKNKRDRRYTDEEYRWYLQVRKIRQEDWEEMQ